MKRIFLLLVFSGFSLIYASPFNGNIKQFTQPDGSVVDLKLYGTEYYMRAEGLDNYTLIRDAESKWICYARLSEDKSELISTGIIYKGRSGDPSTFQSPPGLQQHLDITQQARNAIIKKNQSLMNGSHARENSRIGPGAGDVNNGTPIHPVSGSIHGLCIVVDFSDQPGVVPISEFNDFCNNLTYNGYGNNGSLRTFYSDISGGLVDYDNVVYGYYRAPETFAYYDALPYTVGAQTILGLALDWIATTGFDFSTLSLNPDNTIMAINLMYTGNPPVWAQGMWHHQGYYSGFTANGVFSGAYNCSPANSPLAIAVVAHENGHMIGKWPDTYKYDNLNGPDGIGSFDLMCNYGDYFNPTPPNPLFRSNAGWGRVVDVTNFNGLNSDTANSMTCYRYNNVNDTNEFFLLENRMRNGRSAAISDEGLTIWHIDRTGDNQTTHHEVFLVHADNNYFDENQACYHSANYLEFSASTNPSSEWYNGDPSGLRVWDIGSVNSILDYKLGNGVASPSLEINYISLSGDNNSNGYLEPSESADLNVNSLNLGQINSAAATISCTAVGPNSGYITVNTLTQGLGAISVSQIIPSTFNITLSSSTPIGTVLNVQFLLTDGSDSTYLTHVIVAGVQVIMDNNNSATCDAIFYDPGFLSSYNANSDFTKTISPSISGNAMVADFTIFDLEDEPSCAYDYLQIYDGPSTLSTLIGTYCGTNSPGTITSTDPGGALTFVFHSDQGVVGSGWEANLSCTPILSVENRNVSSIQILPNPGQGQFVLTACDNAQISVMDKTGRIVISTFRSTSKNVTLDLSKQSNGIYFVKIIRGENSLVKKIVLAR
ncbi:MAG: M6 family metalloprotease domain-containing protein [Bacteroidia bacterium]